MRSTQAAETGKSQLRSGGGRWKRPRDHRGCPGFGEQDWVKGDPCLELGTQKEEARGTVPSRAHFRPVEPGLPGSHWRSVLHEPQPPERPGQWCLCPPRAGGRGIRIREQGPGVRRWPPTVSTPSLPACLHLQLPWLPPPTRHLGRPPALPHSHASAPGSLQLSQHLAPWAALALPSRSPP